MTDDLVKRLNHIFKLETNIAAYNTPPIDIIREAAIRIETNTAQLIELIRRNKEYEDRIEADAKRIEELEEHCLKAQTEWQQDLLKTIATEREECAKIAESFFTRRAPRLQINAAEIAAAIRARK